MRREPSISPSPQTSVFMGFFRLLGDRENPEKRTKKNVGGADFEPSNVAFRRSEVQKSQKPSRPYGAVFLFLGVSRVASQRREHPRAKKMTCDVQIGCFT
jgi:hypothetical protein